MPETLTAPPPQMENPSIEFSEQMLSPEVESERIVESVSDLGVEIENKEGIKESLTVLIDEFQIEESALKGEKNMLVMTSIAAKMSKLSEIKDVGKYTQEKEYIADLVMLSVGENTRFAEMMESSGHEVPDEKVKEAIDRFTQPEVTNEMENYIRGPEFDELRKKLGITSKEKEMEVRVLSIVDNDGSQLYGLHPRVDEYLDKDTPYEYTQVERTYLEDYESGLVDNGRKFAEATGREDLFAPAWVNTFEDGTSYLCLSLPTAEKVLYPEEDRSKYYTGRDRERDVAIVQHEYTHTRNRLAISDVHTGLGTSLEELRAEHFSGNNHGYVGIKRFFAGMEMLTGYNPESSFDMEGGYDESKFMVDIVDHVGLEGLLDSLTVIPKNYANDEQAGGFLKSVAEHDGGVSGSFENLYSDMVERFGEEAVQQNTDNFVDKIRNNIIDMKSKDESITITVEDSAVYGGVESYAKVMIDNFRRRYPDESNGYEYFET